ncbi:ESX-1 secretion-associated protein EspI [Mycobacterium talmoniae]|uniref:ESX-1 secretion-associated protein EspI n=1 Tax=Mycobacterium talmoniae TaxID=1858794 RepID=A0A2S8BF72_9MYCO|nr:MinD/ParA family protein [Mycobacterium eburneum]PQM45302.1 ESX-1 secretion-associated protein EspI [Mycobacterium talmoniae]TDH48464.1 hypothetical protein E2F47_23650 [Mycobacterium eburneum]
MSNAQAPQPAQGAAAANGHQFGGHADKVLVPQWQQPPRHQAPSPMDTADTGNVARAESGWQPQPQQRQQQFGGPLPAEPRPAGQELAAPQQAWQQEHSAPQAPPPQQHYPQPAHPAFEQPNAERASLPAEFYGAAAAGFDASLAENLRQEAFTTEVKPRPQSGWRKVVLAGTFGLINPGESKAEREDRERVDQIRANIARGAFIFAVISPRGGVSKTTTTAALGSMFAKLRGAEAIAIDANPNEGNLASRVNPQAQHTFADILRERNQLRGNLNDIRMYTARNVAQLDVLAASTAYIDPATYSPRTLIDTIDVLRTGYRIIGIDCGQTINDDVTAAILDLVTTVVVVTGVGFDSGRAALRTHDWLLAHGRHELLQRSLLLVSDRSPAPNPRILDSLHEAVSGIVWKDPIYVPYDPHLAEATVLNLDQLQKPTYRAYLAATARLASHYGAPPLPVDGQRR